MIYEMNVTLCMVFLVEVNYVFDTYELIIYV